MELNLSNNSVFKGTLDVVSRGRVFGWACSNNSDEPVEVELLIDGESVAKVNADIYRSDLEQAGIGRGHAAFVFDIPVAYCDSNFHEVDVRITNTSLSINASPRTVHLIGPLDTQEFAAGGTWVDASDEVFESSLKQFALEYSMSEAEVENFRHFRQDGFIVLKNVINPLLITNILADIERLWRERPNIYVQAGGESSPRQIDTIEDEMTYRNRSARYLDLHNISEAAAALLCDPVIVRFIRIYLGEPIAGMQTLTFENGTQQRAHQDYPYVHSLRPAALAGAWAPLEKVSIDAGPLFYYVGSHRAIAPYVFAGGSVLAEGDGQHIRDYESYLDNECTNLGLKKEVLLAEPGDVLIWHAALVHGGSVRNNPALTRRSIVSHYTTQNAYPFDRRAPNAPGKSIHVSECAYYARQEIGHVEGAFKMAKDQ